MVRKTKSILILKRLIFFTLFTCCFLSDKNFDLSASWTKKSALYSLLNWASDSSTFYYSTEIFFDNQASSSKDYFRYDLYENKRTCLTPNVREFTVSPDGKELVFIGRYGMYRMAINQTAHPEQIMVKDPFKKDELINLGYSKDGASVFYIVYRYVFDQYELWEYRLLQKTKYLKLTVNQSSDSQLAEMWNQNVYLPPTKLMFNEPQSFDHKKNVQINKSSGNLDEVIVLHTRPDQSGVYFNRCQVVWYCWLGQSNYAVFAITEDKNNDGYPEQPSTWIIYVERLEKSKLSNTIVKNLYSVDDHKIIYIEDEQIKSFNFATGKFTLLNIKEPISMTSVPDNQKIEMISTELSIEDKNKPVKSGYYLHGGNIWYYDKKASYIAQLSRDGDIVEAILAPDETKIAYVRQLFWGNLYPYHEIWMMNVNGTGQKKLIDKITNF